MLYIPTLLYLTTAVVSKNTDSEQKLSKGLHETEPRSVVDLERQRANWTNCEEFLNGTEFDIMRVIDVDWKIFYFWSIEKVKSYNIRFHLPTRTLVNRFRDELHELKPPVNWTAAELFMETTIDFSALFIRANISGLYRLVPSLSFDISGNPYLVFGMKVFEPGYLGILNCQNRQAYALAPVENIPKANEIESIAVKFNISCPYAWSYLETENASLPPELGPLEQDRDDRDDDLVYDAEGDPHKLLLL